MNTILALIASVLATGGFWGYDHVGNSAKDNCPIFIEKLHYVLYPDILCDKRDGCEFETMFGYVVTKRTSVSHHFFDETSRKDYDNFRHSTSKFNYDTYFLSVAINEFRRCKNIEVIAYEMIIRLIASYIEHTNYPDNYKIAIDGMACRYKDMKRSGYDVFCGLLEIKATRTVALMALQELQKFYERRMPNCSGDSRDNGNDTDTLSEYYAAYLYGATSELIAKILSVKSLYEVPDRKIVSKSYVLISNKFTNETGSLVIDAETFVNKKAVNQ